MTSIHSKNYSVVRYLFYPHQELWQELFGEFLLAPSDITNSVRHKVKHRLNLKTLVFQ